MNGHVSPLNTYRFAPIWLLSTTAWIGACDEWPRHANLPDGSDKTIAAGEEPDAAIQINWTERTEEEPNDVPVVAHSFRSSDGWRLTGELSGVGWDPTDVEDIQGDCGEPLAFPPTQPGAYIGDIDWFAFSVEEDATLCMGIGLDDADMAFDWSVYSLNECGEPAEVFIAPSTGEPVGLAQSGGHAEHVLHVRGGSTIGLALAAYWPDDLQRTTQWFMEGTLVPLVADAEAAFCPTDLGVQ